LPVNAALSDLSGQLARGRFSCPVDSNQKHVGARLPEHAGGSDHVIYGGVEEDQWGGVQVAAAASLK